MGIYNVVFGTTDADTELIRTPEIFNNAFFDPNDYIQELIDGHKYIVTGRKGDGKSAYYAKLKCLAEKDNSLETIGVNLEKLNSGFFEKFTDRDLNGGKRYVPMWRCIILLELVKYIEKRGFQVQRPNYNSLVEALGRIGLLTGESVEETIVKLDSTDFSISVYNWISYGNHREKERVIRGANDVYSVLFNELSDIYLGGTRFRMVFDGLDDILRTKDFSVEIITGLIRAANEINNVFFKKTLNFKVIVLIRSDIFDLCRDPDISKIRFASTINLSWQIDANPYSSDLAKIILARFNMAGPSYDSFQTLWQTYFPDNIDGKDALLYMLDNTLYKPRDMLMFFTMAQEMIGPHDRCLCEYEFRVLLNKYSEEYFMVHMQDELTGFLLDDAINELQTVVSRIGNRRFSFDVFEREMKKHDEFADVSAESVLKLMFERGYIGQYRKRPGHPKEEFYFQIHINPRERYQKEDDCQIHRGLIRAFGI